MKNARLYTFAVLYADMLTPKKWRPKYLFTIQNGSHVISCLREYYIPKRRKHVADGGKNAGQQAGKKLFGREALYVHFHSQGGDQ